MPSRNNGNPEVLHPSESTADFFIHSAVDHRNYHDLATSPGFPPKNSGDNSVDWPSDPGVTAVRFVFWSHIPESAQQLVGAVAHSDVVAFESFDAMDPGSDDLSQEKIETVQFRAFINHCLGGKLKPAEEQVLSRLDKKKKHKSVTGALDDYENYYGPALKSLFGTGARAEFLDVDIRHSQKMDRLEDDINANRRRFRGLLSDGASFDALTESMLEFSTAQGAFHGFRERIAQRQIEKLVAGNPGANIAVVYGAGHLILPRMIEKHDLTMQRVFLQDEDKVSNLKGSRVWYNANAIEDMIKSGLTPPEFSVQQAVLDRMAEIILISPLVLRRYYKLDPEKKALLLEKVKKLWKDEIPKDEPKSRRKTRKRLSATRMKLIRAI